MRPDGIRKHIPAVDYWHVQNKLENVAQSGLPASLASSKVVNAAKQVMVLTGSELNMENCQTC